MVICEDLKSHVDAYLDGALEPEALAGLEAHLGACAACAARARGERRIRGALESALEEPAPAGLRSLIEAAVRGEAVAARRARNRPLDAEGRAVAPLRSPGGGTAWRAPALALAAAVAALVGFWLAAPRPSVAAVWANELALDHREHHGPSTTSSLFRASSPTELERWFARRHDLRVDIPPPPPGGRLVGGQLCPVNDRGVAHVVYEVAGRPVSWFVLPGVAGPEVAETGDLAALSYAAWDSPAGGVFVVGQASAAELTRAFPPG